MRALLCLLAVAANFSLLSSQSEAQSVQAGEETLSDAVLAENAASLRRLVSGYFPPRALAQGVSGRVLLACEFRSERRVACSIESETPSGYGFGNAALAISEDYRVAPGSPGKPEADGHQLHLNLAFVPPPA
jgi:hypothetical protein